MNCNVLQHICKCRKKCAKSSGDFSAAELLCFAWDQRDCQFPGKHQAKGPMDFIHKTVKTRNQPTSAEYAKYQWSLCTSFGKRGLELWRFTGSQNTVSKDWNGVGHICRWMRRTRHLERSTKTDVSWSHETFIVPDTLLSPVECYSSPEPSTLQTSAVWISAHIIFQW